MYHNEASNAIALPGSPPKIGDVLVVAAVFKEILQSLGNFASTWLDSS